MLSNYTTAAAQQSYLRSRRALSAPSAQNVGTPSETTTRNLQHDPVISRCVPLPNEALDVFDFHALAQ